MNKPVSVAYEDLKSGIAELINASNLPAFVIESVIKEFLIEISDVAKKQYKYDKEQYEASLSIQDELAEDDSESYADIENDE